MCKIISTILLKCLLRIISVVIIIFGFAILAIGILLKAVVEPKSDLSIPESIGLILFGICLAAIGAYVYVTLLLSVRQNLVILMVLLFGFSIALLIFSVLVLTGEVGEVKHDVAGFCVGDRFYLCENKILCEYDYEERLVFANMAYNPPPLSHLKRQTSMPPASLPSHLMNGHRPSIPSSNGDMNNNMSGSGQPPPGSMANQPFSNAGHLKNGPMSLNATS